MKSIEVIKHFFVLLLIVQGAESYRFRFRSPVLTYEIGGQPQTGLLDINSAENYVLKSNVTYHQGFNPSKSNSFKDLKEVFQDNADYEVNHAFGSVYGYLGEDVHDWGRKNYKFAVIYNATGEPTMAFSNDDTHSARIGINPWMEARTEFGKVVRRSIFGILAKCYNETDFDLSTPQDCRTSWTFTRCISDENVDKTSVSLPLTVHPKQYWQVRAEGYKHKFMTSNRMFNVIFSTTTLDFVVPKSLFNYINNYFFAVKTDKGYKFPCYRRGDAQDITVSVNGQTVVIPSHVYTDHFWNVGCYLRLRPGNSNDWVFGLQFYYAYATCFNADAKTVTLNQSLYGEF